MKNTYFFTAYERLLRNSPVFIRNTRLPHPTLLAGDFTRVNDSIKPLAARGGRGLESGRRRAARVHRDNGKPRAARRRQAGKRHAGEGAADGRGGKPARSARRRESCSFAIAQGVLLSPSLAYCAGLNAAGTQRTIRTADSTRVSLAT